MLKRVFIGLVINFVGVVLASGLDASASDAPIPYKVIVNPKVVGHRLPERSWPRSISARWSAGATGA